MTMTGDPRVGFGRVENQFKTTSHNTFSHVESLRCATLRALLGATTFMSGERDDTREQSRVEHPADVAQLRRWVHLAPPRHRERVEQRQHLTHELEVDLLAPRPLELKGLASEAVCRNPKGAMCSLVYGRDSGAAAAAAVVVVAAAEATAGAAHPHTKARAWCAGFACEPIGFSMAERATVVR